MHWGNRLLKLNLILHVFAFTVTVFHIVMSCSDCFIIVKLDTYCGFVRTTDEDWCMTPEVLYDRQTMNMSYPAVRFNMSQKYLEK